MVYVDFNDYVRIMGADIDPSEFFRCGAAAEAIVEEMTRYRLTPLSFEAMDTPLKEVIRRAVCVQIKYLVNGEMDVMEGENYSSASLGKFSFNRGNSTDGGQPEPTYAPMAVRYLAPTGLLYRGGGC